MGRRLLFRDRIVQLLPEWEPGMLGYSSVLAMYAFGLEENGEYGSIAHRCGGSLAQCDVLHLTYTEAAFRGHKTPLARALVAERLAKKPASRLNRMLLQRLTMNRPG